MRVAFLAPGDPRDIGTWSGICYFMFHQLSKRFDAVEYVHYTPPRLWVFAARAFDFGLRCTVKRSFDYGKTHFNAVRASSYLQRRLSESGFDAIFAVIAADHIAYLRFDVPLLYCADATQHIIRGYYDKFKMLTPHNLQCAYRFEKSVLQRADILTYCSDWAVQSAIRHYEADPRRVLFAPFGANLREEPSQAEAAPRLDRTQCRLLFVGVDWERKGGPIALATLRALRQMGIRTHLTIVGCAPAIGYDPDVEVIPRLDKSNREQRSRLENLYKTAHFFLLPTRAEMFGIVFCEAAAFGLPVVATRTGGVGSAVIDGITGCLLAPGAEGEAYAERILRLWADDDAYRSMSTAARERYEQLLNWDRWGEKIETALRGMRPVEREARPLALADRDPVAHRTARQGVET